MSDIRSSRQSPRALKARFAYMFEGANLGLAFYRGWMPIVVWACEEIDALLGDDKRNFHWTQIKEKFGGARLYYAIDSASAVAAEVGTGKRPMTVVVDRGPVDPVIRTGADIVRKATSTTLTACIVCGAAAEPRSYGGYVVTVCDGHRTKGTNDDSWLADVRDACLEDDDA